MQYLTQGNIKITRYAEELNYAAGITFLPTLLDTQRGALYSSSFEYPGRYTRWDIGFVNPLIALTCKGLDFIIEALNTRGELLLEIIFSTIQKLPALTTLTVDNKKITGKICLSKDTVPEEQRSKQPTLFSLIRSLIHLFFAKNDPHLGLYGAFGYDLVFQFEQLKKKLQRSDEQRDCVLYLPDEIYVVDHQQKKSMRYCYDFSWDDKSTENLPRTGADASYQMTETARQSGDHIEGEYADCVRLAKEKFKKGDLFEVVPGQIFFETYHQPPSILYNTLKHANPSPYGFMINLGEGEFLVGASPEMYVVSKENRIETCPISGTIKRGKNAIEDARNIQLLLNSTKDESELTMCTDVDRNDKSRICEPGTVRVIGRRQIELYSKLIHTVDHIEGILRPEFDALDAFLSHMWVVTVTGAPKLWAMQFIENHEKSPRRWYGGSVGWLGFDGNMNTGLTIRTIRLKNGIASIRVGATLLYDSIPEAEEQETQLKASAFLDILRSKNAITQTSSRHYQAGKNKKVLLIDHQDSFVHTLANYFRQTGSDVLTLRTGFSEKDLQDYNPDLIVMSPGPGSPSDFNTNETINLCLRNRKPIFGVCLGLQAIIEHATGVLSVLDYPMHGKPDKITLESCALFQDLSSTITVGRYHSLYIHKNNLPADLRCLAQTKDGVVMAIAHKTLPMWAVQFHPESILSMEDNAGIIIINNVWQILKS